MTVLSIIVLLRATLQRPPAGLWVRPACRIIEQNQKCINILFDRQINESWVLSLEWLNLFCCHNIQFCKLTDIIDVQIFNWAFVLRHYLEFFCDLAPFGIQENMCCLREYLPNVIENKKSLIIVVIITWPGEKTTLTSQFSGSLIRSNGLCLCKISSMVSQFSTI